MRGRMCDFREPEPGDKGGFRGGEGGAGAGAFLPEPELRGMREGGGRGEARDLSGETPDS